MGTQQTVNLGVIVETRIQTWTIWGNCPFPNGTFPHGFEFMFNSLKVRRIDECPDAEDVGFTVFNPDVVDSPSVAVRCDEPKRLPPVMRQRYDSDSGEVDVPFDKCEEWLGVSHWKLIDLLHHQQSGELEDAIGVEINARNYHTVTMTMTGGKYAETRLAASKSADTD